MLPKIALIMRGRPDSAGRKLIFLRFAYQGKTSWLSLKISILPAQWDQKKEQVKAKNDFDLAKIGQILNKKLTEANSYCVDVIHRGGIIDFQELKDFLNGKGKSNAALKTPISKMVEVIESLYGAKIISKSTSVSYKCAINKLTKLGICKFIEDLTPDTVLEFRRIVSDENGDNLANQYHRNLGVAYRHTIKNLNLKIPNPFDGIAFEVKRKSSKKTLNQSKYAELKAYFDQTDNVHEKETLRRFLVLCKGIRYSDTNLLKESDLQEFEFEGTKIRYFAHSAQKSDIEGLTPFFEEENNLLIFNKTGYLFDKMLIATYNRHLKALSSKLIGVELTSHFGRHYAGDSVINQEGMGIDDVQVLLGISNTDIARVYAKRKTGETLKKIIKQYEKNKTNHLNQ